MGRRKEGARSREGGLLSLVGKDAAVGDVFKGPPKRVSLERMQMFSGGPLSNVPNWPSVNVHTDVAFAKATGVPKPCASGTQYQGYMVSFMLDLFGENWLLDGNLEIKLTKMVLVDDTITTKVKIASKDDAAHGAVSYGLEIWSENQLGEAVVTGTATATVG